MAADHRRVHLISHSLIEEAKRRGWTVTAVTSQLRQSWPAGQERWWPSNDLFRVDAGDRPVGVQFRLRTTRKPHVDTADEARRRAQGLYVGAPRYDCVETDALRVFLYEETRAIASWEDGTRKRIEDRLEEILVRIERGTAETLEARERTRLRAIEQRRRIAQLQRQRERIAHVDRWVKALEGLREQLDRHDAMREALAALKTEPTEKASVAVFALHAQRHRVLETQTCATDVAAGNIHKRKPTTETVWPSTR